MNHIMKSLKSCLINLNFKYFCGAALVPAFLLSLFSFHIYFFEQSRIIGSGEDVKAKVTSSKKRRGKSPRSAAETEIAVSDGGPIFDRKQDSYHHKLWFVLDFNKADSY